MAQDLITNLEPFTRATEFAAILSAMYRGHGDKKAADRAAVYAFKCIFNEIPMQGRIVSTEGSLDKSHSLEYGEVVGCDPNGEQVDIAIDPLENTAACAGGLAGAVTVLAVAPRDGFLRAEETYMWKLAVGPEARGKVDLKKSVTENILATAKALDKKPSQLSVAILDRPRHKKMIEEIRATGAMIMLLPAGDLMPAIATCFPDSGVDMVMGAGGGPEGVLAAAAIQALGGDFYGRLDKELTEKETGEKLAFKVPTHIMSLKEIVKKPVYTISITAVTDSYFLKGVYYDRGRVNTNTFVVRGESTTFGENHNSRDIFKHNWFDYIKGDPEIHKLFTSKINR
ncbi:fructose-bisphosphatase class II family protein [Candidatus Saccharibacteria bacterium]|nr:fructose-bisphosphatase class II family protein [Candidatus Saccharibacteria bacterium]